MRTLPHPVGHVRAHAHHEVTGDDANGQDQPGCQLVTIDEGAERGRARIGNCPFPEHGSWRGRALCERNERARESHPRQQTSRRSGSAVRKRFPRSPEDKCRGKRHGKAGTRRKVELLRETQALRYTGVRCCQNRRGRDGLGESRVQNAEVRRFWLREYQKYPAHFRAEAISPIQNKIGEFLVNPLLRRIVGQPKSSFDLRQVMDQGKILLVNLAKGIDQYWLSLNQGPTAT